ncbi:MAG: efflux RND transporter periplasmic adaptor subunit [Eggerthellaceae bacterium]|nr:efflux RND transporter periplasmic adaptor subunit [Eggerthellaceae bacterium]
MSNKADQTGRKKKWPWVLGGIAALLVVVVVVLPALFAGQLVSPAQSVAVQRGSIVQTAVGTGSLDYSEEGKIELPIGIKILEVAFESGEAFSAGDTLATIDAISLASKITSTQSEIAALDVSINQLKNDSSHNYLTSSVTGRVKWLYAQAGQPVAGLMLEHGALMVLSLDGKMALDIATTRSLQIGEALTVVRENGDHAEAKVERKTANGYTITLSDDGPRLGERVEVRIESGESLGSGALYIHSPLKIVGSTGTIDELYVAENDMAHAGAALLALREMPPSARYLGLLEDREELLKLLNWLIELSESHALIAPSDGIIRSTNIAEGRLTSASSDSGLGSSGSSGSTGSTGSSGSSGSSGLGSTGSGASQAATASRIPSSSYAMVAFTVSRNDQVVVTINVDELDILSINKGQPASLRFDSIPGENFEGTVTKIGSSPVSTTGVAKYAVEITLAKSPSMRIGMSTTATIQINKKDDIPILPLDAIQESGGRVFAYTALDERTGALSGETEIETGISDGTSVEITSGLSSGDVVYYQLKTSNSYFGGFGPGGGNNRGSGSGSGSGS